MPSNFSFSGIFRRALNAYKQPIVALRSGCAWVSVSQLRSWDTSLFFPYIHEHTLLWGGTRWPHRLQTSPGAPQPRAELRVPSGLQGASRLLRFSAVGLALYNSRAPVESVLEGSLISTFWSLSLRDKEKGMRRFLFILLKLQVASVQS